MTTETTIKIAILNDLCRKAMGMAGRLVQTSGICALPLNQQSAIRERVETCDALIPANNPYGECDFGAFEHEGERIFWKIDYYDTTSSMNSEDPTDPKRTVQKALLGGRGMPRKGRERGCEPQPAPAEGQPPNAPYSQSTCECCSQTQGEEHLRDRVPSSRSTPGT
jgi:hypothetical protein